jgi:hypothetical protein
MIGLAVGVTKLRSQMPPPGTSTDLISFSPAPSHVLAIGGLMAACNLAAPRSRSLSR